MPQAVTAINAADTLARARDAVAGPTRSVEIGRRCALFAAEPDQRDIAAHITDVLAK